MGKNKRRGSRSPFASSKRRKNASNLSSGDDWVERDVDLLFAFPATLNCALAHGCVSCAYKITLGSSPTVTMVPNVRPETCPRIETRRARASSSSSCSTPFVSRRGKARRYLVVGDGDFSFSRSLSSLGKGLVATSLDTREENVTKYDNAETFSVLKERGVRVVHQVDATRISETLRPAKLAKVQYDVIAFNFPCIPVERDGQNADMTANKNLVRKYGESALTLLSPGGQVLLTHKTKPPFGWWGIPERMSESGLSLEARVVFDRAMFPPYRTRKALALKSFPVSDAEIYVFRRTHEGKDVPRVTGGIAIRTSHLVRLTSELIHLVRCAHRAPKVI